MVNKAVAAACDNVGAVVVSMGKADDVTADDIRAVADQAVSGWVGADQAVFGLV